jgi:hypothetical protein
MSENIHIKFKEEKINIKLKEEIIHFKFNEFLGTTTGPTGPTGPALIPDIDYQCFIQQ